MMRCVRLFTGAVLIGSLTACASQSDGPTLESLRHAKVDIREVDIDEPLDKALQSYRHYLAETPETAMTPEAIRRLADLQLEREYGIIGGGASGGARQDASRGALPRTEVARTETARPAAERADAVRPQSAAEGPRRIEASDEPAPRRENIADLSETEADFERRATAAVSIDGVVAADDAPSPGADDLEREGPLEAIALYQRLLAEYPHYPRNDQVLYQKARAYDELGQTEDAMRITARLLEEYPRSRYADEVLFRRAEYFFVRRDYLAAESAYGAVVAMGAGSSFYEIALYKLGWTLYKQDFYDEALHQFMALLDYKVDTGYDFDQPQDEEEDRRVEDTYRVISLSFSTLGGPDVVEEYFTAYGNRSYESRIYSHLGEFYLDKLRFQDAAAVYKSFIAQYPLHRVSPHFSMRVIDIYGQGGFPRLVVEAKKAFATDYGVRSPYWQHFAISESPEVVGFLKSNLTDLANHYHALYQDPEFADEQIDHYHEAQQWYREFIASFPEDQETPSINYQLADLLLEHEDYGQAAREYERTAYEYPAHAQAAAAGYAAVFAHREHLKVVADVQRVAVRRDTVESSLKFAEVFPDHDQAAIVLGAAADDLFEMKEFQRAIASAQLLIERYPGAEASLRRAAWIVVAHSSFEIAAYEEAEHGYTQVLSLISERDDTRQGFIENLAASIYQQGEAARDAEDYRTAANHFLRIRDVAPTSTIRAAAEYDAGAALIHLEDWVMAAQVLDAFRSTYPDHDLHKDATRQIAHVYREDGQLSRAAAEYERISEEADDESLKREALLLAGDLYEDANQMQRALDVYRRYVDTFPRPIETAVETRHKIAGMIRKQGDDAAYRRELQRIVDIDGAAGPDRTDRTRYLAAQSALVLAQPLYDRFAEVRLMQPFARSLEEAQRRMDVALDAFGRLVDYEVGDVTAAATFYMAEIYHRFGRALLESERPADLDPIALEEYDLVLEEEAFPFEENSIDVHEKNLELMTVGIFNEWIERSLDRLADLMPGRYAKYEISSGFLGSIDGYAYRIPGARHDDLEDEPDEAVLDEPSAVVPRAGDEAPREGLAATAN
jgi:cellulose synthase operon protein C